jgi:transposase
MTKRTRRKYTEEFKAEAVRLILEEGYSISQAARNLDINANMLGRWKRELTEDAEIRQQVADGKEELKRLREEVRQLKMEREILKNRPRSALLAPSNRNTRAATLT